MKASGAQITTAWSTGHLAAIRAADAVALAEPRMEHRWGQRKPCRARVSVAAGAGVSGSARLRNVSISGAFLETALPLPLFAPIAIAVLHNDGTTHALEFAACVVRVESGGFGIEWSEPVTGSICRLLGCTMECGAARR